MTFSRYLFLLLLFPGIAVWGMDEKENVDPWEPFNRKVFAFNETLDKHVLLPTARGYRFVIPDPAEQGVSNFIANIYEFNTVFNALLQGRPLIALSSGGRFLVNTTVGLFGLIDVASPMGIERNDTDFDQTLAVWGVESGPYLVLPVLGPNTVRSTAGYAVDANLSIPSLYMDNDEAWVFRAVEAIDIRARLIKSDDLVTGDRYIFIRNAYLQRSAYFLNEGSVEDTFSNPEEEDYYEEF
ncbi:MAG TPA: VacJ family lipoprotein [Halioglobus sp.]